MPGPRATGLARRTPRLLVLIIVVAAGAAVALAAAPPRYPRPPSPPPVPAHPPYAVGLRTITIVERRTVKPRRGPRIARTLPTLVRYPAAGASARTDVRDTPALPGRFPLVVFAHGFNVTPAPYAALLQAWARAGFIVAAPVFPLSSATAPGGADERDILNQPGDLSAVITHLIRAGRTGSSPFAGRLDERAIAVAGQSDGGETALAAAYDDVLRDRRVAAAVVLSGAELSFGAYPFAPGSPPLLAVQGTADTTNLPKYTYRFFDAAAAPKYLLALLGAGHLPPYTTEQPQLGIVERTTTAFLDRYLYRWPRALGRLERAGRVPGLAALTAAP